MRGEHVPRAALSESIRERTTLAESRHAVVSDAIVGWSRLGTFQLSTSVSGWWKVGRRTPGAQWSLWVVFWLSSAQEKCR